jgi:hypothetical protein
MKKMKKLLTALAVTGFTTAAFAQGTVQWQNVAGNFIGQTNSTAYSSFTPGQSAVGGAVGATVGNATSLFYYELLVSTSAASAPATVSALSSWTDTGLEAQNGAGANGRILQLNAGANDVANGWALGSVANIVLVGWSSNLGTTWAAAYNKLLNWLHSNIKIVPVR